MSSEQFWQEIQIIRQRIAVLLAAENPIWQEIDMALEDLHLIYEDMETSLIAAELTTQELWQKNSHIAAEYQRYYDLFLAAPIAYLVTDTSGMILAGNQAIAQLLNVPQQYLAGKPLMLYVAESDRRDFFYYLNQLSQNPSPQILRFNLRSRDNQIFTAEWNVAIAQDADGQIAELRIGIHNVNPAQPAITAIARWATGADCG